MRSCGGQSVELLRCEARVAAVDIGEAEETGHRMRGLVVSGKSFCQAAGRNLTAFSKPATQISQRVSLCRLSNGEQRA